MVRPVPLKRLGSSQKVVNAFEIQAHPGPAYSRRKNYSSIRLPHTIGGYISTVDNWRRFWNDIYHCHDWWLRNKRMTSH